jgi:hypothetical protein
VALYTAVSTFTGRGAKKIRENRFRSFFFFFVCVDHSAGNCAMADTDEEFFNLKTPLWEEWVARFLADTEKVKASVVKEDLNIPNTEGKYAFCLYNALTLEECNWLIKQTEALGTRFQLVSRSFFSFICTRLTVGLSERVHRNAGIPSVLPKQYASDGNS